MTKLSDTYLTFDNSEGLIDKNLEAKIIDIFNKKYKDICDFFNYGELRKTSIVPAPEYDGVAATYTEEARHLTDMDPAFANRHHMNEQYCLNLYAMECLKPDCLSRPPYWDYLVSMVEEEHRAYENINDGDQDLMDYKKLIDFFYDKLRWVREQFSLLTDYEHEDLSDDEPVKYMSDDEDDINSAKVKSKAKEK